ncbi:hypothetical protein WJU23_19000 [Prosthecobacter sp. SYSU 5D2]|uniref:hypothetical protein n=1 Tax=Prosthecobacter sp. SYSU 5D2 TaxID=3134134 RepID=UPI0031FEB1D2
MATIYKVLPDPLAPELILDGSVAEQLLGESVIHLSPDKSFQGKVSEVKEWKQFYRVGSNAFAISEQAWVHCMEMYYVITENDLELLSVQAGGNAFRVIHPRDVLPPSDDPSKICDMRYIGCLFRIESRPHQDIYCYEGMAVPDNEFKHCYDKHGFTGLLFEEVWTDD